MSEIVTIDGSYGEGGGQVLRTSVALAAITGRPLEVVNVRGKRAKPGLQPQHLMAVKAAGQLCDAELRGAEVQSQYLRFVPSKPVAAGEYRFEIGTAGAATLVVQTVLMPLALAGEASKVTVTGGTHNPMAPPVDYLAQIFLPAIRRMGIEGSIDVPRFGFFPKGGGEVVLRLAGGPLRPIVLDERGALRARIAKVITSGLPEDVARRGAARVREIVSDDLRIVHDEKPSLGPGAAVFTAEVYENGYGGFTGIGARGKRMEVVAEEAAGPLLDWSRSGATVDEHLADQLVLPAALAEGVSRWRTSQVTEHLRTVAWVVGQFLERTVLVDEESGTVEVR